MNNFHFLNFFQELHVKIVLIHVVEEHIYSIFITVESYKIENKTSPEILFKSYNAMRCRGLKEADIIEMKMHLREILVMQWFTIIFR